MTFETYASTDLLKHGLDRYVHCPDFRPLLGAVVWEKDGKYEGRILDFVEDYATERQALLDLIDGNYIVAHNAGFEQAVLEQMGIPLPSDRFIDSAVLARAAGAAGKLEAAAPQLLGVDKLASGYDLIKLFSIPGKYQEQSSAFDPQIVADNFEEWAEFARYCAIDAELSLRLAGLLLPHTTPQELANNAVTMDMNNTGWHVDTPLVQEMQRRYQSNVNLAVESFRIACDAPDLNLSSFKQLQEWCADRGVRATSFDEEHVAKLMRSITKKLDSPSLDEGKRANYEDVANLLQTKQLMGGSSLKKLDTILNTTGVDGRLHDQYLHIGAGATFRTTGRGVQMQNLKRLNGEGDDMLELFGPADWDNDRLASNLRQVFTASDLTGRLVVGDFSSVESRGLAWQAGEKWKIDAYAKGQDLYKVLAGIIFHKDPADVSKPERQIGKVGELACGYGAGAEAVRDFAAKMGVELSEAEATKLVKDWRNANPHIVQYWFDLDQGMHDALLTGLSSTVPIDWGYVTIHPMAAPQSLRDQVEDQDLKSFRITMRLKDNTLLLSRVIHGVHIVGRNIQYWKPSERKTGDLWTDRFTDPKTGRTKLYSVYGGKLAGLLTQSLCREVFFHSLRQVHDWCAHQTAARLVGQFHDEIVLDWVPQMGGATLMETMNALEVFMSDTILPGFPLAAEIKSDYRYTK